MALLACKLDHNATSPMSILNMALLASRLFSASAPAFTFAYAFEKARKRRWKAQKSTWTWGSYILVPRPEETDKNSRNHGLQDQDPFMFYIALQYTIPYCTILLDAIPLLCRILRCFCGLLGSRLLLGSWQLVAVRALLELRAGNEEAMACQEAGPLPKQPRRAFLWALVS